MEIVAARVNGEIIDLSRAGEVYEPVYENDEIALDILRHSCAHVMAEAVKALFPDVKVAIGPSTETGFYYDFDRDESFTDEHLTLIENKMREIISAKLPFIRSTMKIEEAKEFFRNKGEIYKLEILEELEKQGEREVSLYMQGGFVDLCRGPHIPHTGYIKAFKLLSVAGAYWRGDERNKMLQRIYGTAFFDEESLEKFLKHLEEAKERDHRKLGKELDLFSISDEVGPGLVIYHPNGAMLRYLLEDFERKEHLKRGYQMVIGPQIMRLELWKKSGHYDNYRENMYFTEVEGQVFGIKPMNCIAHIMVYKSKVRSYRDLPLRYFELGTVHRHERSGVLHGLLRVRCFTQDDAHIFCRPDQVQDEIANVLKFVDDVMGIFGFSYEIELSTRPEKSLGSDEIWELATNALKDSLEKLGKSYVINEGDGAFYGPKIDIKLKDALDRKWQCATIQCDFNLPERFDLAYIGEDNKKHRPVMLHRVILGSIERFISILIEHYKGAFPVWLAPVQVMVVNITDKQLEYAKKVVDELRNNDIRVEEDFRNEKLGFKIREAQLRKIPYVIIIGDNEMATSTITYRGRDKEEKKGIALSEFLDMIKEKVKLRR
jgi:threonyl-tRNA synthetase